jgi:hypothetical protein
MDVFAAIVASVISTPSAEVQQLWHWWHCISKQLGHPAAMNGTL